MKELLKKTYLVWLSHIDPLWVPVENAFLNFYSKFFPKHFENRLSLAIERGLNYFEKIENWEIDSFVVLHHIVDESHESRLRMAKLPLQRYKKIWKDPFLRIFDSNYDPERDGTSCPQTYVPPREMHELMMKCVQADRLDLKDDFIKKLLEMDDNGNYGTTHILLGCLLLKKYGNLSQYLLDKTIQSTIPSIIRAQRVGRVSDIFSERTVFLQWIGLYDAIEPAWIARIIFGQMKDDGWYWQRPPFRTSSYQHPTCLALAALLQYRNHLRQKRNIDSQANLGEKPCL